MRDDDRRRRPQSDDELFSSLMDEIEKAQSDGGLRSDASDFSDPHARDLGPRTSPPRQAASREARPAQSAAPAYSESSLADDALGELPTSMPGERRPPRAPKAPPEARRGRPPRLLLVAICVVLAGAAYMFWPHGKPEPPLGVGERTSVVTRDGARSTSPATSDVDIAAETRTLVPEGGTPPAPRASSSAATHPRENASRGFPVTSGSPGAAPSAAREEASAVAPAGGGSGSASGVPAGETPSTSGASVPAGADAGSAPSGAETSAAEAAAGGTPAVETTAPAADAPPAAPPAAAVDTGPRPGPEGLWALQVGAFQAQENADKKAAELREHGLEPIVKTASTAGGGLMFKVWIGYFPSRDVAAAYARQKARQLGGPAQPVHR